MAKDPYAAAAQPVTSVHKDEQRAARRRRRELAERVKAKKAAAAKRTAGFQHGPDSYVAAATPRVEPKKPPARNRGFQHNDQPTLTSSKPVAKPSFETAVRAKKGDKQAQREVAIWIKGQKAKRASERQAEALTDRALFGAAEKQIKDAKKTAGPVAMALAEGLSPTVAIEDAWKALRGGNPGLAAVLAASIVPMPGVAGARTLRNLRALQNAIDADAAVAAKAAVKAKKAIAKPKVPTAKQAAKAAWKPDWEKAGMTQDEWREAMRATTTPKPPVRPPVTQPKVYPPGRVIKFILPKRAKSSTRFQVGKENEGFKFYNQSGHVMPPSVLDVPGGERASMVFRNLYDENDRIVGSIVYDKSNYKGIYVESIYIKPSFRGELEPLFELVRPLRGKEVWAEFENVRLKRLFKRIASKSGTFSEGTLQGTYGAGVLPAVEKVPGHPPIPVYPPGKVTVPPRPPRPPEPPAPPGGLPPDDVPPVPPTKTEARVAAGFQHNTRTLQVGEKVQQLPEAKSRVSRMVFERPADIVSEVLQGEHVLARGARKVHFTGTAEARVAKAAARQAEREAQRATSRVIRHLENLPDEGSPEDVAHFWWAQMPAAWRNERGLRAVREMQARELDRAVNGEMAEEMMREKRHLYAAMDAAEEEVKFEYLKLIQALDNKIRDIPQVITDIPLSMQRLDVLIANPPKLNNKIIDAIHTLSGERKALFIKANKLQPEDALDREGRVSQALGFRPSGEEAYIGHRLDDALKDRPRLLPSGGTGKAKVPRGLKKRNRTILIRQGRARQSTHVAKEDWQASQAFELAVRARDDLAKMGRPIPFNQHGEPVLPKGFRLVNPQGHVIPPTWKQDRLAALVDEGGNEDDILRAANEITETYIVDQTKFREMLNNVAAQGRSFDDLRIVPEQTVERYYAQITPFNVPTAFGKTYDVAVDAMAASIIFFRLGYIPKNVVQNLVMSVPHQGVYLPFNLRRAGQIVFSRDEFMQELERLIAGEVGLGASGAIGKEAGTQLLHKPAQVVTRTADQPFRITAWLHEAAIEGVIPRFSAKLSEEDIQAIRTVLLDESPAIREKLEKISARATDAMGDFGRMTPTQRKIARRFLIIPGWLVAGSRYPFHFAATHPGRSAAMAYVAAGEPGAPEELQFNKPIDEYFTPGMPSWLQGIPLLGGHLRTGSLLPVTQPWEILQAAKSGSPETLLSLGNPVGLGLIRALGQEKELPGGGTKRVGYGEAFTSFLGRIAPNYDFIQDMITGPDSKLYPGEGRLGRSFRELGVVPVHPDPTTTRRYKLYESGTPAEKARFNNNIEKAALINDMKRIGMKVTPQTKRYLMILYNDVTKFDVAVAGGKTPKDKLKKLLAYDKTHDRRIPDHESLLKFSNASNNDTVENVLSMLRDKLWSGGELAKQKEEITSVRNALNLERTPEKTVR